MFKVLVIGTSQRKNIHLIYKIASILNDITFIFVGKFTNSEGLNNLIIKPRVTDLELVNLYNSSNLLLFPSLTEGFGLPILEAQFFGLPVITSNREPMKSVCGDNGGLLVNPFSEIEILDAILEIKNNKSLVAMLIECGKDNIKQYHISKIVNQYSFVYELIKM